jgi:glycosyltransferase involved in cell wall biosynthesis
VKILCIDAPALPFAALGHEIRSVHPASTILDLPVLPELRDFRPDLIFQQESLHHPVFLKNLEQVPCPALFWSLDTHLNIHWQKYYLRLFDAVGTPHVSFFTRMPARWTPKRLFRLAMFGPDLPWHPHAERTRATGFVGLDNPKTRPLRSRFLRILQPLGLTAVSGLNETEMLEFYRDTRIVPNEAIAFEVNFRLTEAAGAGACVLSPDIGPDLNELYAPDREIVVYGDGQDMVEKLFFFLRRPDLSEKIGRAAWEKTQSRHLARHRAQSVLDAAAGLTRIPCDPVYFAATLVQRGRGLHMPVPEPLLRLINRPDRPEVYALLLRCLSEMFPGEASERVLRGALRLPRRGDGDDIAFAVMGHALHRRDLPLFSQAMSVLKRTDGYDAPPPVSLYHAALVLAENLRACGRLFQPGLEFRPKNMVPETALEALLVARLHADGDTEWARRQAALCTENNALLTLRLQALNVLIKRGASQRVLSEYAQACMTAYDIVAGQTARQRALL